jgi:hypothetical protein
MYGLLTTLFWIGLVVLLIAMAFLASPLLALILAAFAGVGLLIAAGLKRAGEQPEHAGETNRRQEGPRYAAAGKRRGGAPVSGEGGS